MLLTTEQHLHQLLHLSTIPSANRLSQSPRRLMTSPKFITDVPANEDFQALRHHYVIGVSASHLMYSRSFQRYYLASGGSWQRVTD